MFLFIAVFLVVLLFQTNVWSLAMALLLYFLAGILLGAMTTLFLLNSIAIDRYASADVEKQQVVSLE